MDNKIFALRIFDYLGDHCPLIFHTRIIFCLFNILVKILTKGSEFHIKDSGINFTVMFFCNDRLFCSVHTTDRGTP